MKKGLLKRARASVAIGNGEGITVELIAPPLGWLNSIATRLPMPEPPKKTIRSMADGYDHEVDDTEAPEYVAEASRIGEMPAVLGVAVCMVEGGNKELLDEGEEHLFGLEIEPTEECALHARRQLTDLGVGLEDYVALINGFKEVAGMETEEVAEAAQVF